MIGGRGLSAVSSESEFSALETFPNLSPDGKRRRHGLHRDSLDAWFFRIQRLAAKAGSIIGRRDSVNPLILRILIQTNTPRVEPPAQPRVVLPELRRIRVAEAIQLGVLFQVLHIGRG